MIADSAFNENEEHMLIIYLIFILVMSLISFFVYFLDKRKAKKRKRRVPESVLLTLGFFGGAIGAIAAMQMFRHKTRHNVFYAVNSVGLLLQMLLMIIIIGRTA